MKKMLIIAVMLMIGSSVLMAQERDQDRVQDQDRTKLVMIDGEMLEVQERAQQRLTNQLRLNDGTILESNGRYTTKFGEKLKLRDGECLDNDGIRYRNEYQYRYKIQQENKGLDQAMIQERNRNRIHYAMVDGEVWQFQTMAQRRLQKRMTLNGDVEVETNGLDRKNNGKQLQLRDGECLNNAGVMFKNLNQFRKMNKFQKMKNKPFTKKPGMRKTGKM
ncbi:MAG: hypothetical protein DWP94_08760 [Flavobacterium sp.]|nr:MAG: hypothetical protein DWP94_08760 [Flavobacterium sp.]